MTAPTGFTPRTTRIWALGDPDAPDLRFGGIDATGVEWIVAEPRGWRGGAPVDLPQDPNPGDGAWLGRGRRQARVLEFNGAFRACSAALLDAAELALQDAVEVLHRDTFVSVTESPAKQMAVRCSGAPIIDVHYRNPRIRTFSFVLTAGDPLKYAAGAAGLVTSTLRLRDVGTTPGFIHPLEHPLDHGGGAADQGGQLTVYNLGRVSVAPVVEFYGPCPAPRLTNATTGEWFGLTRALVAGETAVVDFGARMIMVGGASQYALKEPGSTFFRLRPGSNDLRFTAAAYNAAAYVIVKHRPAWK
jgi:hypothetical protein